MSAVLFAQTILVLLMAEYLLETLADWLNRRRASRPLPAEFRDATSEEEYANARAYQLEVSRLGRRQASLSLAALLIFWNLDGFARLDSWTAGISEHWLWHGLLFIGVLALASQVLSLPSSLYKTFSIDARFNLNTTSAKTWLLDLAKGTLLGILLGGPLLAALLACFHIAGQSAWIWGWAILSLFSLVLMYVAPTWLLPLFNKFSPLEEGELRDRIVDYARRNQFPLKDIMVMDGSKRSKRSNAFLSGFGSNRRIAFYDTLINSQGVPELEAVLAHEVGHFKHRHIPLRLVMSLASTGITFFLLGQFIGNPALSQAFGLAQPSIHMGLVGFMLLYTPVSLLLGIVQNWVSRVQEFQADAWSARTIADPEAMVNALKVLSRDNLANLDPHPLHVMLHYDHPPVLERIAAIRAATATAS